MAEDTVALCLIGGSEDGTVARVTRRSAQHGHCYVVAYREVFDPARYGETMMIPSHAIPYTVYTIEVLHTPLATLYVGIVHGMSSEEAMQRLVTWYGKKRACICDIDEESSDAPVQSLVSEQP